MKALAAICGVLIVLLGVWSTSRTPTEVQSAVEILCLVGGMILCFLAVVIARIDRLAARVAAWEAGRGEAARDDAQREAEPPAAREG